MARFDKLYKAMEPIWLLCPPPKDICACLRVYLPQLKANAHSIELNDRFRIEFSATLAAYWNTLDADVRELMTKAVLASHSH